MVKYKDAPSSFYLGLEAGWPGITMLNLHLASAMDQAPTLLRLPAVTEVFVHGSERREMRVTPLAEFSSASLISSSSSFE